MGGHGHEFLPKQPWSPSGGWWYTPKNANTNLLYISLGMTLVSIAAWKFGERITVQSSHEVDDDTITRWNNAAKKSRESAAIAKVSGEQ
ncbi:conserved hypothetical protein [Geotrichum candidum]|uniref:Uncharacterized protein n=1 Tax=Geotrichum candidum TaxID=1173061 RepID=A0A0J9XKZ7_GEOCN|nr:conserved hypothetical protein [Geotrichum candidum]